MLEGGLYYAVYLFIVTILTVWCSLKYASYPNSRLADKGVSTQWGALILSMLMVLFIGFRPKHKVFVDSNNYIQSYYTFIYGKNFQFDNNAENLIFDNLFAYLGSNNYEITVFFIIIAFIYFGGTYLSSRKLFPRDTLYGIVIYLAGFSTFSYATNGIKAGAAAVIFLCALGYYRKRIICALFLLISIGFHHSMVLPVTAFTICYFYRKPKVYLWIWLLSFLIAAAHISYFQNLFGGMADESGSRYLLANESSKFSYITGFRMDFIIYGLFPIVVGYFAIFKKNYQSKLYNCIYCTYVLTNSIWMLCMYASFTNRIVYLSWFMLPYVLVYPFFDKKFMPNQYKNLNKVVWVQLGFTLFMQIIYYG